MMIEWSSIMQEKRLVAEIKKTAKTGNEVFILTDARLTIVALEVILIKKH